MSKYGIVKIRIYGAIVKYFCDYYKVFIVIISIQIQFESDDKQTFAHNLQLLILSCKFSYNFSNKFSDKFKGAGDKNFKDSMAELDPRDLLTILKSTDHAKAIKNDALSRYYFHSFELEQVWCMFKHYNHSKLPCNYYINITQ